MLLTYNLVLWGQARHCQEKKDKKQLKLYGEKVQRLLHMVHLFSKTEDKAEVWPQNLAVNSPWKENGVETD